jgi:CRISPR-associated protein Cas6
MFWQEEKDPGQYFVPDDVVDLAFSVAGRTLPVDHAYSLAQALARSRPGLEGDERLGIHQIHVAESGNGWYRPESSANEVLYLSRRTKMVLRVPKERRSEAEGLVGARLDIDGHALEVGRFNLRELSTHPVQFARYVVAEQGDDEERFLRWVAEQLGSFGITVRKLMCGKSREIATPNGPIYTRSLMVADLKSNEAVRLQQRGIGPQRKLGCGLFVAHKGIKAVAASQDAE